MGKKIVILGGGESGIGTAILAKKNGYDVFLSDKGKIKDKYKEVLKHIEIEWEDEKHTESKIFDADVVMKSPGIPDKAPMIVKLKEKGISVVSEIEFASWFSEVPVIGITGSNGKTTVTNLVQHLLKEGGINSGMGGNIGNSYAKMVAEEMHDWFVLELSSFQLDGIEKFKPHIAILTNITPDHLDRYDYKLENYIASKFRIAENQTEEDYFIYDADDKNITDWLEKNPVRSQKLPFSIEKKIENGAYIENENIVVTINNTKFTMPTSELALQGKHNAKNAMAASMVSQLLRIRKQTIRESMASFQGVEHRLEKVLKINNVLYINDSKATNVNATFYALESMESETVWILGGVDKGNVYDDLLPLVNEKVKAIICLGVDNEKIVSAFGNIVDTMVETTSMSEAVQMAYRLSDKGDNVLLSPACASFDLFENYEDRGRQFKEAVRNL
ncbi:UDP-N-acetylmuramoyl-L-alanine--D-glutamate ligase [Christiangramia forsetii]|uniref:UDP-N-acetylmuramoylalanine--D-glutamate ligase n=2 Tax=Christiangramia forsetii TaxID=411153 RepID=MURD_CHRFK|nr:UDP-N-acetylmuramoyl-L-alanine--D-glutamate ligase [Christiangramia forsetii]A0M529.1 RecName: Full=UDP-N-acetylmuramoylalanine--D-glutamate ligase; AltName: Full=D-glutamic acid-adding enzyme; AltName: Full=UDP-N-acetylmuramoyl-L-alanyl-D-glutamate synthetase [Christiangramia forsetii KT0803]GGG21984.1 UDP-N-acetylmuramoylalanine--D-glutamate ligase [Christiangramia forsetii]CAL67724.1 UDP-N-acetylmuramoylalanine--D-glutamate ligase [Christiangramia forsetii KT0803]